MNYVELHACSAFSFLEGASLPEALAERCAELGMPAMALLDRDGVYGSPRFHMGMKRMGLPAHIGSELTVEERLLPAAIPAGENRGDCFRAENDDPDLTGSGHRSSASHHPLTLTGNRPPGRPATGRQPSGIRYPLLVESRVGYQNLCRLVTRMKLRAKKGEGIARVDELQEFSSGLVCLTGGGDGPLAAALARGGMDEGRRAVERLLHIFGRGQVYVEVQRHFDRVQEARNQAAVHIARALHLPLLATNGVAHALPREREVLDVFTCIREHCNLDSAGRLLARNSERHLKSGAEMARVFSDLPEAISHTTDLSARLQFTLADLGYEFPRYPVPEGDTMMSFLRKRTEEGMRRRYVAQLAGGGAAAADLLRRARRQVERELGLIEKLGLEGYFLIVWDLVRFCGEQGILAQGRGSAANSAVCYSLGITAVDPVKMGLLFERFLSEERGEWPDIDLDLPSGDQRERVIQHVYQKYGRLGAAMTANVITYRGRSAAREMGKALGFDPETLDRLSGLVGSWEYRDPSDSLERQTREAGFDLQHGRIRKFLELCQRVQDLPRHLGQHSGGMVICQGTLDSVAPLENASMPGRVVVQWDKEDCADLGLIKVDLLGLGMMAVLEDSLEIIPRHYGHTVDLGQLPADDALVYETLQKADTVGMFQVESRAQMACLPRLHPQCFYDVVIQVALIRPGPIVGQMVNPYIKRRQGRERVEYSHPSLEPILERTLGIPLFQEQLLRIAMVAANFTGGEAEELRRALGARRSQKRMVEIEAKLRRGMDQNGFSKKTQEQIILSIVSFALYGFPESHAASFALIAYASAYLKCHYLAAFTAALLNNQPMGFYRPATIVKDAQRHGLKIRPVDVMHSQWQCTLEDPPAATGETFYRGEPQPELRLGFLQVRGLRKESADALVAARNASPLRSIDDLVRRTPQLRRNELVMLAQIGALNSLADHDHPQDRTRLHRRDALWQVERAVRPSGPLLEALPEAEPSFPLAMMSSEERLVADYHGTGLTIGRHPMSYRRPAMDALGVYRASELAALPNGKHLRIAGCVIVRQRPGTAHGFIFLSLEDETGIANAIIDPGVYEQNRFTVISEKFLMVEGELQNIDKVISVKARRISSLDITAAPTQSHDFH